VVKDLIREALYPHPRGLKLVTKVGWRRDASGGIPRAQRPNELREQMEANLRSLRVERLDLSSGSATATQAEAITGIR
jgi:pyridoxine 4-dehydrogenase